MIPLFKVAMSPDATNAVAEVLESGYIGQGPKVEEFEKNLRGYFNHDLLLTVNSATSGLHLANRLLIDWLSEHSPGDIEVLTTPLTCTATNWPTLANNLPIRWVDIDPNTLNIDLNDLERKLSPKTKIIIIVHWGGYPVDLDQLQKVRDKCKEMYGFRPYVIQDCAHAFGSKYRKYPVGVYPGLPGSIGVYSFQAIKHLTSVDGGMITLQHQQLFDKAKLLRWYGIDRDSNTKDFRCEADVEEWGYKFHMNDVNATIGVENLKVIDSIVEKHKSNGLFFNEKLKKVDGVTLLENKPGHESAYWIYSMKVERQMDFMAAMADRGISVSRVHERNDKHSCVAEYVSALPQLDKVIQEMICIPSGWWVGDSDREFIVDQIKRGW
jgi:dTDP-4-amino-4,6-dideoxygalactose transaminase